MYSNAKRWILCLMCGIGLLPVAWAQSPAAAVAGSVGGRVAADGQIDQLKSMDKTIEQTLREEQRAKKKAEEATGLPSAESPESRPEGSLQAADAGVHGWTIGEIELSEASRESGGLPAGFMAGLRRDVVASNETALVEAVWTYFRDNGYYFCHVESIATHADARTVDFRVDAGRIHEVRIGFREKAWLPLSGTNPVPREGDGKWFSRRQIQERYLRQVAPGAVFNYSTLYDRFHRLNAHPDLTADVTLRPPSNAPAVSDKERAVDVDVVVTEKMPLHFVFDVDNSGTDASENWMGRLTAQYLNLTKHDDVLTLNYQNSLQDFDALGGLAGSYYLPHTFGTSRDFAATLYGGWTDVDSTDVVPEIDVQGMGWFVGLQEAYSLVDTRNRSFLLSVGVIRRHVEDNLVVAGTKLEENEVTVMPFSVAGIYADRKADGWNGLNFATIECLYNVGDFLGTSNEEEMKLQRVAAEPDYMILRAQVARLQLLSFSKTASGVPMLFATLNG